MNRRRKNNCTRVVTLLILCLIICGCATPAAGDDNKPAQPAASVTLTDTAPAENAEVERTAQSEPTQAAEAETSDEPAPAAAPAAAAEPVILGDEQASLYLPHLEGRRVALFSNHTGIVGDRDDRHILDELIANGVTLTAILSPEHGFRGTADAGASVSDSVDEQTGIPIHSLYQSKQQIPAEILSDFDTLVIDIQDVGLRYYTYYITMVELMDVCAQQGKSVVLLDRPNPNGFYVDGPLLQEGYTSGVGRLPIPVVHGLTLGELAQMVNGEGWLEAGVNACDLTVIPCRNYTHQTRYELNRRPSPNLRTMRAIYLYASLCFFENTVVSVGRGTETPFEIYGSPYLKGTAEYTYCFTPVRTDGAADPPYRDTECFGRDLRTLPEEELCTGEIRLDYLIEAYHAVTQAHPEVSFWGKADKQGRYWIDLLSGSDDLRHQIEAGRSSEEIRASWQEEITTFRQKRSPYLLYEE